MMNQPRISGYAHASMTVNDVEDLRTLVKFLDRHHVNGSVEVELDRNRVFVNLVEGEGEFISCGDHVPPDDAYDVLLNTHKHFKDSPANYPANYEEALEESIPVDIPQYDWPSRDKYGTVWDGLPE